MKTAKIVSYAVIVSSMMFILHLRKTALVPASSIGRDFNIAASLDGSAATEVVADRILAIDGVRDVRVRKSPEILEEYRREKIISEKIRLEDNPFTDHLVVYPETLDSGISALAASVAAVGGVDEISYDRSAVAIYRELKKAAFRMSAAAAVAGLGVLAAALFAVYARFSAGSGFWPPKFHLRIVPFAVFSAVCYGGFAVLARADGISFDYAACALILASAAAAGALAYDD